MTSTSIRFASVCVALAATACGPPPPPPVPSDAGPRDAQTADAPPADAATPDGDVDGGDLSDAGDVDGGGVFDPSRCRAEASDVVTLATDGLARARDVGVSAGALRMAVAWSSREDGFENVRLAEIPATGPILAAAESITTDTAISRDPALAPNGNGWIVTWYANTESDFEAYAQAWQDGRVLPGSSRTRLTMRAGRDDQPAILATSTGALVSWTETRGAAMDQRVPVVRPLTTTGAASGTAHDAIASSLGTGRIALGLRADGYLAGWIDSGSATPSALLQQLTGDGTPTGTPITVSTEGNADGTIDLATTSSGGAVAFGVAIAGIRPEVRARLVDETGAPSGPERVITEAPASGRDASITSLGGGYVIAYRRLGTTPMIRVELRDAGLDAIGGFDVAPASDTGGRVTIRATAEGRMVVGWADVDAVASTTRIRAARIRCD